MNMEEIQNLCDCLVEEHSQSIIRSMDTLENCETSIDMKASRCEINSALTPPNSNIEMELDPIQVDKPITNDVCTEYVKLDDLKDMVEKLISQNVMEHHIKHFDERMFHMEKVLGQFSEKVEQLSIDLHNITKTMEPLEEIPLRLVGGEAKSLENIHDDDYLETKSKESTKQRNYNALFRKFKSQTLKKNSYLSPSHSTSKLSLPEPQVIAHILDAFPFLKKAPSSAIMEEDVDETTRRLAERRQFETNMLMYRKSQFSLRLNNRINKLAKKFWDSSDFLVKKQSKRHADKPSQTEETQSD